MASKAKRQKKITTEQMPIESMRKIFDESQRLDKHQICLQQMTRLQISYSKTNQLITTFYKELIRNIKYTLWVQDWRSPYGQNNIGFVIKYLLAFGETADNEDVDGLKHEFIDAILEDVIIPYTDSKKAECRINACNFIRRLSDELEDLNDDIYEKIRKALLDRSVDKISSVRAAAILALHRFQDIHNENDLVIQAIHFHLNYDPDQEVRHSCLKAMAASNMSLSHFIGATRDIKDYIRKTAYLQISEKLQMKYFKIEQRLTILKNGLKDRSLAVRKVVESVLIPSWVKSCNNDLIELLIALDIQTDIELIEKILEIYFKHLIKEKVSKDSDKTKFNQLVDEFRDKNLANERVFKVTLNVENVFLWRFLCEFSKTNQIQSQEIISNENCVQNTEDLPNEEPMEATTEENQSSEETLNELKLEKIDLFDLLVPDVSYFCAYLERFLENVKKQELNVTDALDFEVIFCEFMKIVLLLDIGDEPQRKILIKTLHQILGDNNICNKFHNYITPLMNCLAKKGFNDSNSYLEFTAEIISEILNSIVSQNTDENEPISEEPNRELEEKRDQLMADIEKYRIEIQELENEGKATEAEELHKRIDVLENEIKTIKQKITINALTQSSQTSLTEKSTSFTDQIRGHPETQLRFLHIFSGCLEFGDFNEVNAVMQTLTENVCLPGILSDNTEIRCVATRCLGLVCLSCPQYFKKYLHLLIEIFSKDFDSIKLIALQSIFDSLCEHGINIFEDKTGPEECGGGDGPDVRQTGFENTDEDFITSLKEFFIEQLDSENNEIRQTTAQGVSKLLIHCRMYSPELLSKLIIIWFTPNENQEIIQFIGEFLRLYSLAESQGVIVGQSALEEAFVITLQTIYEKNLRLNSDNLIKFFLKLIADENHVKLAKELVKRMIETDSSQTKLVEDYLLSAISQLNLVEMEAKDLKQFEENLTQIEDKFVNSKSKKVRLKLTTIMKNIDERRQQLTADSAFADDFRSVDENNSEEPEDNVDVRHLFDDNNRQRITSDSEAESFRTCPESPLQKKRQISENCDTNDLFIEANSELLDTNEDNVDNGDIVTEPLTETNSMILDTNENIVINEDNITEPLTETNSMILDTNENIVINEDNIMEPLVETNSMVSETNENIVENEDNITEPLTETNSMILDTNENIVINEDNIMEPLVETNSMVSETNENIVENEDNITEPLTETNSMILDTNENIVINEDNITEPLV